MDFAYFLILNCYDKFTQDNFPQIDICVFLLIPLGKDIKGGFPSEPSPFTHQCYNIFLSTTFNGMKYML